MIRINNMVMMILHHSHDLYHTIWCIYIIVSRNVYDNVDGVEYRQRCWMVVIVMMIWRMIITIIIIMIFNQANTGTCVDISSPTLE
jgi:hypothetical protein